MGNKDVAKEKNFSERINCSTRADKIVYIS